MILRCSSVALGLEDAVKSTNPPSSQYLFHSSLLRLETADGRDGRRWSGENCAVKLIFDDFCEAEEGLSV